MIKKPRLSLGQNTEEDNSSPSRPRLGIKSDERNAVTSTKSTGVAVLESVGRLFKGVLFLISFAVILLAVLYSGLSATLMFTSPSGDSATNRIWVARSAFPGGLVPDGSYVYGSASSKADPSILTKVTEGYIGTTDFFVAKTIAGPAGKIAKDANGFITVNGVATTYKGDVKDQSLSKQYLALCTDGACERGSIITIPQDNIVGEAKGFVDIAGFSFSDYETGIGNEPSDAK